LELDLYVDGTKIFIQAGYTQSFSRCVPSPCSETYRYFDLPFCSPEKVKDKSEALGEVLNGDRLVDAPYKLDFRVDLESKPVCSKKLTTEDVAKFRNAVAKDYYFQMYYDDLPLWGFIGKVEKGGKADPSEWK